ncbi:MAG: DUF4198 domain-containing protein [Desulfobacca sp.]|uniref:DUF4198 domain-containing protein n=1 Tax=Desulfobacca sp. TaxID=2067990 RepID=UPI004049CEBF
MKKSLSAALVFLILLGLPLASAAHVFWLIPAPAVSETGKPVQVEIGFGHKFPKDEELQAERLQFLKVIGPDGKDVPVHQAAASRYAFTPTQAGTYLVVAQMQPGFVSRTPEGMKMANKKEAPTASNCFRFDFAAKTLVTIGPTAPGFDRPGPASVEIIPLTSPAALKVGEELPVRVLFQGKPLANVEIKATHDRWQDPKEMFAVTGKTDAQGEYRLKLATPGLWLVAVYHKTPYHDLGECDENLYLGSLTVAVQ